MHIDARIRDVARHARMFKRVAPLQASLTDLWIIRVGMDGVGRMHPNEWEASMRDHRVILAGIFVTGLAFVSAFAGAPHFAPDTQPQSIARIEPPAVPSADAARDLEDELPVDTPTGSISVRSFAEISDQPMICPRPQLGG